MNLLKCNEGRESLCTWGDCFILTLFEILWTTSWCKYGNRGQYTKAHLLFVIGKFLFASQNRDVVYARYLLFLKDIDKVGDYARGAAVLTCLYKSLHNATRIDASSIGSCLTLLQIFYLLIWFIFILILTLIKYLSLLNLVIYDIGLGWWTYLYQ